MWSYSLLIVLLHIPAWPAAFSVLSYRWQNWERYSAWHFQTSSSDQPPTDPKFHTHGSSVWFCKRVGYLIGISQVTCCKTVNIVIPTINQYPKSFNYRNMFSFSNTYVATSNCNYIMQTYLLLKNDFNNPESYPLEKLCRLKSCFHTQVRCGTNEAQPAETTPGRRSCDL